MRLLLKMNSIRRGSQPLRMSPPSVDQRALLPRRIRSSSLVSRAASAACAQALCLQTTDLHNVGVHPIDFSWQRERGR